MIYILNARYYIRYPFPAPEIESENELRIKIFWRPIKSHRAIVDTTVKPLTEKKPNLSLTTRQQSNYKPRDEALSGRN